MSDLFCSHIALQVRDAEKSVDFYRTYCDMQIVHERVNDGTRVIWLGWGEDPPKFVIVLIEIPYETNTQPPMQHIGLSVASCEVVNDIHQRAALAGLPNLWPPVDAGEIVGYYCGILDPDGNRVEFSHGQRIG